MSLVIGSSKQKSKSQSTSDPVDMTPGEFVALRPDVASAGLEQLNKSNDPTVAQGDLQSYAEFGQEHLTAGITDNEAELIEQLMATQRGNEGYNYLSDVIGGKYLPGQEGSSPFLQAAIEAAQRPTFEALEKTLGRTLPSYATLAGHNVAPGASNVNDLGSTPFARLAGEFSRDAARVAGDIAAKMSQGVYEFERGAQGEAIQLRQGEIQKTIDTLEAVALPRLLEQFGIENGLKAYESVTNSALETLRVLAGLTAPTVANESQSTSRSKGSSFNVGVSAGTGSSTAAPSGGN